MTLAHRRFTRATYWVIISQLAMFVLLITAPSAYSDAPNPKLALTLEAELAIEGNEPVRERVFNYLTREIRNCKNVVIKAQRAAGLPPDFSIRVVVSASSDLVIVSAVVLDLRPKRAMEQARYNLDEVMESLSSGDLLSNLMIIRGGSASHFIQIRISALLCTMRR